MSRRRVSRRVLCLSILVAIVVLSGCAPKEVVKEVVKEVPKEVTRVVSATAVPVPTTAPRPKLKVWVTTSYVPLADELRKRYILEWANTRNVEIELVMDTFQVIEPMVNAAVETKALPDVLVWHLEAWGPQFNKAGLLADVTDLVTKFNQQGGGLYQFALDASSQDGKYFGIPVFSAPEVYYFRKDLLDAKGLKIPQTFEEVLAASKALVVPGKLWPWAQTLSPTDQYDAEMSLQTMFASYGATMFGADGKTPNLNNDGARKVLAMLKDAWDSGLIPPDSVSGDNTFNNKAYLTGASAFIQNSGSVIQAMRNTDKALLAKTVCTRIPAGPNGVVMINYVFGLLIPKNSQNIDLAKDLVTYLMDVKRMQAYGEAAGANAVPLYKDIAKTDFWTKDAYNAAVMSSLADLKLVGWPGPMTVWALEGHRMHTMSKLAVRVLVDKWSADDAIKEAEDSLVKYYQQFQ